MVSEVLSRFHILPFTLPLTDPSRNLLFSFPVLINHQDHYP